MISDVTCTIAWISQDLPHQVWEAQAADGMGAYTWLTRFLHNKIMFWGSNLARCYVSYLSPDYIAKKFTLVGLAVFLVTIWWLVSRKKYKWLALIFLIPAILLFL
jgi:hypothetical protein